MKVPVTIWLTAAAVTALGIATDMRRLCVHRAWLSLIGWALLCACAGVLAAVPYLVLRPRVRRQLIATAWALIGDETHAMEIRRQRLLALRQSGLVGEAIFRACLASLENPSHRIRS